MAIIKQKRCIYVCHTYYHVYVSFLREPALPGPDFMDAYEDPLIHRQNEQI